MATRKQSAEEWKWEVDSAANALQRAEEVKQNPKLMSAALRKMVKDRRALDRAITGVKRKKS